MCRRFSQGRVTGFVVEELQADEIRSFTGRKTRPTWIFAAIEVWSRLWPSTVVGRRSYRNTWALMRDISTRMEFATCPLIVTDGFDFYEKVIRRVFGPAVLLSQVLKTRRHDRIVQVDRRERMGASWRFEAGLTHSEDSSTLNTSFIERMNLTIRQGSAYLSRRTLSHARSEDKLEEHLELLRCHYNFVRPHGALKFGREVRTPAMQADLLGLNRAHICVRNQKRKQSYPGSLGPGKGCGDSPPTSVTRTDLETGVQYQVLVQALSGDGYSEWSETKTARTRGRSLRAWFESPPERHDGKKRVKVQVAFSEPIDGTPENVGEHGVDVEGGRVT